MYVKGNKLQYWGVDQRRLEQLVADMVYEDGNITIMYALGIPGPKEDSPMFIHTGIYTPPLVDLFILQLLMEGSMEIWLGACVRFVLVKDRFTTRQTYFVRTILLRSTSHFVYQ